MVKPGRVSDLPDDLWQAELLGLYYTTGRSLHGEWFTCLANSSCKDPVLRRIDWLSSFAMQDHSWPLITALDLA